MPRGVTIHHALGIDREAQDLRADYDAESLRCYDSPHVALLYAPNSSDPHLTADVGRDPLTGTTRFHR